VFQFRKLAGGGDGGGGGGGNFGRVFSRGDTNNGLGKKRTETRGSLPHGGPLARPGGIASGGVVGGARGRSMAGDKTKRICHRVLTSGINAGVKACWDDRGPPARRGYRFRVDGKPGGIAGAFASRARAIGDGGESYKRKREGRLRSGRRAGGGQTFARYGREGTVVGRGGPGWGVAANPGNPAAEKQRGSRAKRGRLVTGGGDKQVWARATNPRESGQIGHRVGGTGGQTVPVGGRGTRVIRRRAPEGGGGGPG